MASHRRKNLLVSRRRVEDEGEGDYTVDNPDVDNDSLSDGSISDEEEAENGSETSHVDESPLESKGDTNGNSISVNGVSKTSKASTTAPLPNQGPKLANGTTDTEMMMNGLKISESNAESGEAHFDDLQEQSTTSVIAPSPAIAESSAHMDLPQETPMDRRKREHEEYKKKRDADPAFVPNRGAFFMHDHRHAGPAANGFRPFGRGRGRGGRGGIGGPFTPIYNLPQSAEPTDSPWTHDMHEAVNQVENRNPRGPPSQHGAYNNGIGKPVPQAPRGIPPNRSLSTTKHIGNVQIRVHLDGMKEPIKLLPIAVNQYTRLPDHRPPLRRDKPVRISLPDNPPRYIFPAVERSFIFIPRAMRPNQQGFGSRNRGRPGLGSIGGYSRRTSIYGGSIYGGGSVYTPSVAMSRRSSLAYELPRDAMISPTGSTRPIVRLPPPIVQQMSRQPSYNGDQPPVMNSADSSSIDNLPRPQTYPLPQKPTFRENRPNAIPMHQPRPQKAVSVADIESPASLSFNTPQQYQQPFHQQVPPQVNGNGFSHESLNPHSRNASYPSQASTGTPLSQIPERAIHAQPFQPNSFQPQQGYYPQQYQMMQQQQQQGFYYPQQYNSGMTPQAPPFVSAGPHQNYPAPSQQQQQQQQPDVAQHGVNLVAQEANGMVYYYDASQIPAVATFPAYPPAQPYPMQQVNMGGMMTPSPDAFYYTQAPSQGVVYYPQ